MNQLALDPELKDPVHLLQSLTTQPENYWVERGERMVLHLFKQMSERVPAYKYFLKKNKLNPRKIKSIADLKNIPPLDKNNYLRVYPREQLCWDGRFSDKNWTIFTTSGSTGKPYYFPYQREHIEHYALTAELYLRSNFQIHQKSTLYIVAFPMGAWIGGVFTYHALKIIADRGSYALSVITPGIHKLEIINAVKELGKDFEQVIIGAYAPFLKDFIADGIRTGLKWEDYNVKFVFSAETFSETFRDYVQKKTGLKNIYTDTLNHYGTVDLGTMSHETPLAILTRRLALEDERLYKTVFRQVQKLPTLTQYLPELFYFEEDHGNLYCSSNSGLPLVRYDLKDHGGSLSFEELVQRAGTLGIDLITKAREAGISDTVWKLPFVYVYERSDFSVSFYAFQIYPETIRKALQHDSLENKITGKFTMLVKYGESGQQIFEINVELRADVLENEELHRHTTAIIVEQLLEESSEYRETHQLYGEKVYPQVVFWPYEDTAYFKTGTKQEWVKRN